MPAGSYALTGPIVNVADGDTVTLRAPGWAYTARRGDYLRDPAMPGLQRQAREAGRGLWAQSGAIEPWKWRYDCWRQRRC
ncbi:nuclease [Bordetella pertussis]|nr:nuclease [Bordetella pertussis]